MKTPLFRSRSGAALVITLLFLVLITLLVVGFSETSRVERVAARNHFEQQRATELAQRGLDRVTATLFRETVDSPDPALEPKQIAERSRNWISQPGQLIVPAASALDSGAAVSARKQLSRAVRLHSGAPGGAAPSDPVLAPPDLNIQTLVDQTPPTHLITDRLDANNQPQAMRVRWVYLRQDGSRDADPSDPTLPNENPDLTNTANPIVGRYAYWADDDSSKINYNLAWKRNAGSPAHPSQINLTALTLPDGMSPVSAAMADAIRNFTAATPGRFFNSFADARQIGAWSAAPTGVAAMLNYNKFELTHFNHDPDTTFFGEDRILLTTDPALVPKAPDGSFARKFLDIRKKGVTDPGRPGSIDPVKFDKVLRETLVPYLTRTDWPMAASSFAKKFYGPNATQDEVAQVAANILGYVIAKESAEPAIPPIRFSYIDGKFEYDDWRTPSYQALTRQPLVTESAVWQEATPSLPPNISGSWPKLKDGTPKPLHRTIHYLELHLPLNYGFSAAYGADANKEFSLAYGPKALSWFLWLQYIPGPDPKKPVDPDQLWFTQDSGGAWQPMLAAQPAAPIFNADVFDGKNWINGSPKSRPVLEPGSYVVIKKEFYAPQPLSGTVPLRCGLSRMVPITGGSQGFGPRDIIAPQTNPASYTLGARGTPPDQIPSLETDDPRVAFSPLDWRQNAVNTLGGANKTSSLGKDPESGTADQDTAADGKISDASLYMPPPKGVGSNGPGGDNGRISSLGELGYIHTGTQGAKAGKAEDQRAGVPWRTLRLQPNADAKADTVPDWALLDLFGVPNTGILGANAVTTPNGSSVGGRINVNSRVEPFALQRDRGLLALLQGTSVSNPTTVAANIYNHQLARQATSGAFGKAYGYPAAYDNPWEICEIAGVTDGGEISEKVMREIGSLITARGDVFSIYSVGQALLQTPNGKLVVTGEQRQHSVVERVLDMRGTNDPRDDRVSFRTVYRRNLNP
jgi:hypothetical protein